VVPEAGPWHELLLRWPLARRSPATGPTLPRRAAPRTFGAAHVRRRSRCGRARAAGYVPPACILGPELAGSAAGTAQHAPPARPGTTRRLVTSSIPGEGKTTTSSNLAVAFAQAGRTVILLDADLRKPGVHKLFDLPNVSGLTSLLRTDDVAIDDVAQATEEERLRVVTTGPLPPNPAELLGSHRMQTILERLVAAADLVIVDSPPLQAVTDAAILASITDGTLLVIDAGRTRRAAAGHGREALAKSAARVLGAALNRLSQRAGSDYVYYDYYGAYGAEAKAKSAPGRAATTKAGSQAASTATAAKPAAQAASSAGAGLQAAATAPQPRAD
jgi:protein-tyrosine kinase